jgi:hypothetical protein
MSAPDIEQQAGFIEQQADMKPQTEQPSCPPTHALQVEHQHHGHCQHTAETVALSCSCCEETLPGGPRGSLDACSGILLVLITLISE